MIHYVSDSSLFATSDTAWIPHWAFGNQLQNEHISGYHFQETFRSRLLYYHHNISGLEPHLSILNIMLQTQKRPHSNNTLTVYYNDALTSDCDHPIVHHARSTYGNTITIPLLCTGNCHLSQANISVGASRGTTASGAARKPHMSAMLYINWQPC
jgi:hypothetical protein